MNSKNPSQMNSKNPHHEAISTTIQWKDEMTELKIMPRDLNIVWGNDNRYWRMPDPAKEDPFAELLQVSWLEVTGSVKLIPGKNYEIGFTVSLSEDAFGWNNLQVYIMAKLGKRGRYVRKKVSISKPAGNDDKFDIPSSYDSLIIPIPQVSVEETVYFGLYEVWSGKWKGGLRIHSAFVRETNA